MNALTSSDLGLCLSCMLHTCLPVGLRRMAVRVGSRCAEAGGVTPLPSGAGAAEEGGQGEKDSSNKARMRELSTTK